jgi:hypothetical protein
MPPPPPHLPPRPQRHHLSQWRWRICARRWVTWESWPKTSLPLRKPRERQERLRKRGDASGVLPDTTSSLAPGPPTRTAAVTDRALQSPVSEPPPPPVKLSCQCGLPHTPPNGDEQAAADGCGSGTAESVTTAAGDQITGKPAIVGWMSMWL